jgi:hypothetical protein
MKIRTVIPDFAGMTVNLPDFSPPALQHLFRNNIREKPKMIRNIRPNLCHTALPKPIPLGSLPAVEKTARLIISQVLQP